MASVKATASNIEVASDKESATLTVELRFNIDPTVFKNSKILMLLDGAGLTGFVDEKQNEVITVNATMEKQETGEWVFTRFE